MSMKTVKIIDGICIAMFLFMMIYIFALPEEMQDTLLPVFQVINPYRTGAWLIGAGFLITCIWGKGRAGLGLRILMLVLYLITAWVSLFGLIALTENWELLWYAHPVLLVLGCIAWVWNRKRSD
jgi:hypothetical protein